jgi:hypothetical protein
MLPLLGSAGGKRAGEREGRLKLFYVVCDGVGMRQFTEIIIFAQTARR